MYVLHPLYQKQLPESYFFKTVGEAREAGSQDFHNDHTPDTKGFYICEISEYVSSTDPELVYGGDLDESIFFTPDEQVELAEEVTADEPEA